MNPLLSSAEMQKLDSATLQKRQITAWQLMKEVSEVFFQALLSWAGVNSQSPFLFLLGPGHNGGDGWLVAERLRQAGHDVLCLEAVPAQASLTKKAKKLFRGGAVKDLPKFGEWIVVDAVFGTGGRSQLSPQVRSLFAHVKKRGFRVVSIDCPSGLDTTTAVCDQNAIRADLTLSIGAPKLGFWGRAAAEILGEVRIVGTHLFVNSSGFASSSLWALGPEDFSLFRERSRLSHKGSQGRVAILAGSPKIPGAAWLAAEAAARAGAGYTTVFLAEKAKGNFRLSPLHANFLFRDRWSMSDLLTQTALVVGPGGAPTNLSSILKKFSGPVVADADALRFFEPGRVLAKRRRKNLLLTPHPGEAGRILGQTAAEVERARLEALNELCRVTESDVYLKGAQGLLRFYDEPNRYYVNLSANPIFAKAGSGDVLSGILGGFLAQKPDAWGDGVRAALVFQAAVGEVLREKRASIASDQFLAFSEAFRRLAAWR